MANLAVCSTDSERLSALDHLAYAWLAKDAGQLTREWLVLPLAEEFLPK